MGESIAEVAARVLWAHAQRRIGCTESDFPRTRTDFRKMAEDLMDHPALSHLISQGADHDR